MNSTTILAICTFGGSILTTIAGVSMLKYRIEQLEKKMDKHNSVVERTYILEGQMTEVQHDIRDLKAAR